MLRNDLICSIDQIRIDQDLQYHLLFCKMMNFEVRRIFIISQTETEFLHEEMKAI